MKRTSSMGSAPCTLNSDLKKALRNTCFLPFLFSLLITFISPDKVWTQEQTLGPYGVSAKVLFIDYNSLNSISSNKISNGLEISYSRNYDSGIGLGLPLKIGLANIAGSPDKSILMGLDLVARYMLTPPESSFKPYVFGGAGIVFEKFETNNIQIPAGLGMYYRMGESSFITLQLEYRKSLAEKRDNLQVGLGFHFALRPMPKEANGKIIDTDKDGVPDMQDHCPDEAGPVLAYGCPDTDGDGVANGIDDCPIEKGMAQFNGCPDTDGDGIPDQKDECPLFRGTVDRNGCPAAGDRDGDGVPDSEDRCPDEPGLSSLNGCPSKTQTQNPAIPVQTAPATQPIPATGARDSDNDGVTDDKDKCPTDPGKITLEGCPDRDNDGIIDKDDRCPDEPGLPAYNGCPLKDMDNDGILDSDDECPSQPGIAKFKGCPDTDGDGIPDKNDKCPNESGPVERSGCPIKDSDKDGILDENDKCPNEAGSITAQGCPDADGDGIPDKQDKCPTEAGPIERNGCPKKDSDKDGIMDDDDKCPTEAGSISAQGCPDADGDGIQDKQDKCPAEAGPIERNGCPHKDSDKDGILDDDDKCPAEAGSISAQGCPDSDGDGVQDRLDKCPRTFGTFNGCPDTDGDGVDDGNDLCPAIPGSPTALGCPDKDGDGTPDKDDKCPDERGTNQGCPDIKPEDKEVLKLAAKGVQFETGKATLLAQSFNVLDRVATIVKQYPRYDLHIGGHTDNVGNPLTNLNLSEERAKSCYEYLLAKGVPPAKQQFKGYGETRPLGENTTEKGREANRRVEFNLILK